MYPNQNMTAWMEGNVINVTYQEPGKTRIDLIRHNIKSRTTKGSIKYGSINAMLDASDALFQWIAKDPVVERALGL